MDADLIALRDEIDARKGRVPGARAAGVFHLDQARVDLIPQGNQIGVHVTSP